MTIIKHVIAVILLVSLSTLSFHASGQSAILAAGIIEATSGGFKFPNGSIQVSANNPNCSPVTAASLPFTINTPGLYCFTESLDWDTASGNAIVINTNDVVIDMQGWTLDGFGGGLTTTAIGITASGRSNITIRNGTIRGFRTCINLDGNAPFYNGGYLLESTRLIGCWQHGIIIQGTDAIIRHNHLAALGYPGQAGSVVGIFGKGNRFRFADNDIGLLDNDGIHAAYGIMLDTATTATLEYNRISDVGGTHPDDTGIYILKSANILAMNNMINTADVGIDFVTAAPASTGAYQDNVTLNVTSAFSGGGDNLGGNVSSP